MLDAAVLLSLFGLVKQVLVALLAVLNGVLALLAAITIWKSYLLTGIKVMMISVVVIPIVGIVIWWAWGRKKVEKAS